MAQNNRLRPQPLRLAVQNGRYFPSLPGYLVAGGTVVAPTALGRHEALETSAQHSPFTLEPLFLSTHSLFVRDILIVLVTQA